MKTKVLSLCVVLLMEVSAWANVTMVSIYDDCSENGQTIDVRPTGQENGYTWVNLGLSVMWASCNVGANQPEEYGNYYAWGEVAPKKGYEWYNYKFINPETNRATKYCIYTDGGFTDNKTTLDLEDDAANVNWGKNWRMPTIVELEELANNCTWTQISQNGINGYQLTSRKNRNSIFIPAAGYIFNGEHWDTAKVAVGFSAFLGSSSLNEGDRLSDTDDDNLNAYILRIEEYGFCDWRASLARWYGISIRPVCPILMDSEGNSHYNLTLNTDVCKSANVFVCNHGQQVNVTAVPKDWNRHFIRWSDGNTDNPRLVTITQDTALTAVFADDPVLTVVPSDYSRGYVYGGGQFKPNTSVEISTHPNLGYHFTQWSDGNTDNPRTVVLTCDTIFTAEFAQTFSGQCGYDLYWQYEGHTLTISGTGVMYDYNGNDMPWLLFRDTTDVVILEQGITHIGNSAFNGFVKLNKIDMPSTLTSIGTNVFVGCRRLYDIYAYPTEPPVADNSSFANYNVNLYVPCDNLRDYQMDAVFGTFKYIQCMSTTDMEQVSTDVTSDHAAQKVFRSGQVYILRGSVLNTLTGIEVK